MKYLQARFRKKPNEQEGLFDRLSESSLRNRFDATTFKPFPYIAVRVLEQKSWQQQYKPAPVFNDEPELEVEIVETLTSMRTAGVALNSVVVQSIIKGVVLARKPSMLAENGGTFTVSRRWASSLPASWGGPFARQQVPHRRCLRICKLKSI